MYVFYYTLNFVVIEIKSPCVKMKLSHLCGNISYNLYFTRVFYNMIFDMGLTMISQPNSFKHRTSNIWGYFMKLKYSQGG